MPDLEHHRPRVLLGNLAPFARLGMLRLLEEDDAIIVLEEGPSVHSDLVVACGRLRPDAVVLDLDHHFSRDLGVQVRTASPETKVILWARDEALMEVLDPGAQLPRLVVAAAQEELRRELSSVQARRAEE